MKPPVAFARALLALALTVPAALTLAPREAAAEEGVSAEARTHFDAGVRLLLDQEGARYEEAYREFHAAYAASRSSRILGNLGLCAMKLERDAEAVDAYERYLAEVTDI